MADKLVIIFAKAPEPGQVKTRLIPALGAVRAAMLHAALVERALRTALHHRSAAVQLCCAPTPDAGFFRECAEDFDITLTDQGAGDLGARMLRALERALVDHTQAIIIGADCPSVTPADIDVAFAALDTHDTALFPAEDGGYVLIGARRTEPRMFAGIEWGAEDVFSRQSAQLGEVGLTMWRGAMRWDVDRPEDLERLAALRPPLACAVL